MNDPIRNRTADWHGGFFIQNKKPFRLNIGTVFLYPVAPYHTIAFSFHPLRIQDLTLIDGSFWVNCFLDAPHGTEVLFMRQIT